MGYNKLIVFIVGIYIMADLVEIGFVANTSGIKKANSELNSLSKGGDKADSSLNKLDNTTKKTDKSVDALAKDAKILADKLKKTEEEAKAADNALKGLGKGSTTVGDNLKKTAKSTAEADKKLANFSRRSGMAGIQFQQFIGQIQGGQSAMVALSQQSADLGFVLGAPLLGAIAGISASVVGMLLPSLLQTKDAMGLLETVSEQLKISLTGTSDGVDELSENLVQLAKKSEALAKLQISASLVEAEKQITIASKGIEQALDDAFGMTTESILRGFSESLRSAAINSTGSMEDVVKALAEGDTALLGFGSGASGIEDTVRILASQFKITKEQAVGLALSISDIFEDQSVMNIKKFENTLSDLNIATGGSNKEIAKLAKAVIPLFDATSDGVNKVNLLRQAFGDFNSKASEVDKVIVKFNTSVKSISESLFAQNLAMREGEEVSLRYNIAQELGLKGTEKLPEAINAEVEERFRLIKVKKEELELEKKLAKDDKDFDKLIKDVENFGGAWTKTGSIVVDAFGSMSDAINDYSKQMAGLDEIQERINNTVAKNSDEQIALDKAQIKLNEDKVSAELSGMAALSKASGSLFAEKTAAAKGFAALSKIIAVAEIALSFQKIAAGTAETTAHVANETTKSGANALTAITGAFAAPFPINFIAGAAMIGIMASLVGGISGGGGGGGASTEPKLPDSSVFGGGDPSESLGNTQDRFEDTQIAQLAELRGIRGALDDTQAQAAGLAVSIMRNDALNTFREVDSSTRNAIIAQAGNIPSDIGIDLGNISITESDVSASFREIQGFISTNVSESAKLLGLTMVDATVDGLSFSVKQAGEILSGELDGEELVAAINEVISTGSDRFVEAALPGLLEFQRIGEGAFETLTRVAQEQAVFSDNIAQMGIDLTSLSDVMSVDVAQSVITLMGGLENFSEATNSFFTNFFTDSEQMTQLGDSLGDVFASLDMSMVTTRDGFRDIVSGIDLTSESGQELFATLMEITPALDEYIQQLEAIENKRFSLSIELLKLQGNAEEALALERQKELDSLDESLVALQKQIFAQEDLNKVNQEAARINENAATAKSALNAELSRIDGLRESLIEKEKGIRDTALSNAESALRSSFDNELSLIKSNASARISALNAERSTIQSTISSLSGLQSSINNTLGKGSVSLSEALSGARTGDFSKAQGLDFGGLANLDPSDFSSKVALEIAQGINRGQLNEIGNLTGSAVSDAERQLNAIDAQTAAVERNALMQESALRSQLEELVGIDEGVLSLDEAIAQYQEAQLSLDSLNYETTNFNYEQELAKLDMMVESANDVYALHEQAYNEQIEALNNINTSINNIDISGSSSNLVAVQKESTDNSEEIKAAAEESKAMTLELLKTNKQMASSLQSFELNGMDTRVI